MAEKDNPHFRGNFQAVVAVTVSRAFAEDTLHRRVVGRLVIGFVGRAAPHAVDWSNLLDAVNNELSITVFVAFSLRDCKISFVMGELGFKELDSILQLISNNIVR